MTYQDFLAILAKPAARALLNEEIDSFEKLAMLTEKEVLAFHGVGPSSIPKIKLALSDIGLGFKH